mmetsp:Transcript_39538/g.93035  ORF Transcript_39538/g.93035 Transcript_39538/m.93035 type:complete len:794 (+) Transcript_39538:109-2490(+)
MALPPPLTLCCEREAEPTLKILAAASLAGVDIQVSGASERTPCGLIVPVLKIGSDCSIRYTAPILHRIARTSDCGLLGKNFLEESQVDSWLQWAALELDHHFEVPDAKVEPVLDVLEAPLRTKTFLVGQRLTLADISVSISLRKPMLEKGVDALKKSYPSVVRWWLTCKHQLDIPSTGSAPVAAKPSATAKAKAAAVEKKAETAKKAAPADKQPPVAKEAKPAPAAASSSSSAAAAPADADGDEAKGSSKKDEKRKAKEAEKAAKEEAKRKREAEQKAAAENKFKGPDVTLNNFMEHAFGNLLIQSQCSTGRTWTSVKELLPELKDQMVWLRARVHNSRKQGGKLVFITLRQDLCTVQAVVFGAEMAGFAGALPDESVVDIYGKVVVPEQEVVSCSQSKVEVNVEKIFCIGRSVPLPLQLADASRSEKELEEDPKLIRVGQDVRLDNRVIDLRTVANQAILRIQSGVCQLFREFLTKEGFVEIHTPKLISAASEGGADVFRVDYFEGNAYLAQSPQLYKQMALMTDLPRVFEIGPVFRSEQSFTHRHMTEFTGLDLEMTFKDHYTEVLTVLDELFNHIFTGLSERFRTEVEAVRSQYPFQDLKWKHPCLKLKYPDAIKLLRSKGPAVLEKRLAEAKTDYDRKIIERHLESVKAHEDEEDISTEDEKVLGVVIREEYGEEFYIIDKFPKAVRPFYTMADPNDDRWTNSYDLFLRGEEITSGAQRIHDPQMLVDKATAMGVDMKPIQPYVDSFKYGAFPHAGAGIGLERVVMLFMNLNNIRKTSMFPRDPKRLTP